jgi:hypothetical protein
MYADMLKTAARYFHQGVVQYYNTKEINEVYGAIAGIINAKVYLFNGCTIAMAACIALRLLGQISLGSACVIGGLAFLGREVAEESFKKALPDSFKTQLGQMVSSLGGVSFAWVAKGGMQLFETYVVPMVQKPGPSWKIGSVVILYHTLPSSLDEIGKRAYDSWQKAFK